ncbi:hypothetical protein [Streptomyces sp. NPDC092295]|uniref:hypothetical protein n=1 Tax=Streptomyces sp. NPDC092295 TaxID=3366011 RepID=UPI0037F90E85
MTDVEITETAVGETTVKPKRRTPRKAATDKPDPMDALLAEMKEATSHLGAMPSAGTPEHRRKHHDGRAAAWGQQYAHEGTSDSFLLSLAFEASASYEKEARYALLQLAGAALALADRLDGK